MTKNTFELPDRAFFAADARPDEFHLIIQDCISRRGRITAKLGDGGVTIEIGEKEKGANGIALSGKWIAPDFRDIDFETAASKVLLPFYFEICEITLSYSDFYTMGHNYRPLSDFFMRNLMMAFMREAPVYCKTLPDKAELPKKTDDLKRQYYFIAKSIFREAIFDTRGTVEVIDLIKANAFLPLLDFKNPVLESGAKHIRCTRSREGASRLLAMNLQETRREVFKKYAN